MKFIAEVWIEPPNRPAENPFVAKSRSFNNLLQAKNWVGHIILEEQHATGSAHIYRVDRLGEETEIWSR